ncbi:MAG TPA: DUF1552 domain-containing protein [Candidatus Acidoferrales bacterium]|jgi:hypothetical protein|nr:DUF1552 domain-containing protein [Candidatus Acidoferrales bacterium]
MNVLLKRHLRRRTFLRGIGAAIGLPFLDAMRPALAFAPTKPACRMAFLYFPNGVQPDSWTPKTEGDVAALPEQISTVLEPLIPYRNDIMVLAGLTNDGGRAKGDGPGDHGRAGAAYLTGMHPKKTFGKEIQAGVSIDQVVANAIGSNTRFPSLQLSCEDGIQGGNCDNGYSCAYSNSISWRTPSTPNPPEIRPRAVFERLFGNPELDLDPVRRARMQRYNRSVLDSVMEDTRHLQGSLGASDRRKVDEYLYAIREIEGRIQKTEQANTPRVKPTMEVPSSSVPEHYAEHSKLIFDLMVAAFQTDSTRVITFQMAIEQSNRAYREIGISDSHHGLTHHGGDKEKIAKCIAINRYEAEQFAYFIGKLKSTPDGDGTLFDHIMVSYGSGLGRDHDHDNLPTILTGRGNGLFRPGRHIKFPSETPLANLHLTMAQQMGVPAESFADSTGKLRELSEI